MTIRRQPGIDERWKLVATLGVTFLIAYFDRLNIALAMPLIAAENGWTAAETARRGALLMGLFYAGFGVASIFLTPWGSRLGPRKGIVVIVALWSGFTALGAIMSQFLMIFMASRILLGLAEGIHPPLMNQLTNTWFAPSERSRANSVWVSGLFIAILTAPVVLVPVMDRFGWRRGFYVLAVGGLLISLPLVLRYVHDRPCSHPRLPRDLALELERQAGGYEGMGGSAWPALRKPAFLLMMAAGTLNNMVALGVASWLPTYLASINGVRYTDLAHLAAIPYAASLLGLGLWAIIGDRTNRRTLVAAGGYLAAGALAVAALAAGNAGDVWLTVALLSAAVFCVSAYTAAEFAVVQRLLPRPQVANGTGLFNGLTTMIGGGLGPFVVGGIIDGGADHGDLATLFGLCLGVSMLLTAVSRRIPY